VGVRAPNVFVLIVGILIAVGVATWFVPGGKFDRVEKELPTGTQKVVVPGSFQDVDAKPQGPWQLLQAPFRGFEKASGVIGFILLVGGAFGVLARTGAIPAFLLWFTVKIGRRFRLLVIPILMGMFSLGGALFGMSEEIIVFVPLTVPLAIALGYDTLTGVAIPFIGTQVGFATAFVNPFTLGIAKGIAEQPIGEGREFRILAWLAMTALGTALVAWHAHRVGRDPSRSPTREVDDAWRGRLKDSTTESAALSHRHVAVLLAFAASMAVLGIGALRWDWYITELAGLFIGLAIACGILGRIAANDLANAFVDGAKDMIAPALLVGFSRGILVVAEDAQIIDTMLSSIAGAIDGLGPTASAELMYAAHTGINFFVPSGSGQAALTMPVMTPLADLIGVHRETAILAFQLGDGLTNLIIPTSAVLIAVLSMARLELGAWFRWIWKRQLVLCTFGAILIALAPW
jgi:uncharacterized ion transporter superfamily protein YfcC